MEAQWPGVGIVRSALRGIREVFKTEDGAVVSGFKSDKDWIFWASPGLAICSRCNHGSKDPDPPTRQGLVAGSREPLFDRGGKDYAIYLLTHLHKFYVEHESCERKSNVQEAS